MPPLSFIKQTVKVYRNATSDAASMHLGIANRDFVDTDLMCMVTTL